LCDFRDGTFTTISEARPLGPAFESSSIEACPKAKFCGYECAFALTLVWPGTVWKDWFCKGCS